jgi:hypothetical protein
MRTRTFQLCGPFIGLFGALGCSESFDYQVNNTPKDIYPPVFFEETGLVAIPLDLCQDDVELNTGFVPLDESCIWEVNEAPLEIVQEWRMKTFSPFGAYGEVLMTPVVGQFTDDNGDETINSSDVPDILLVSDKGSNSGHGHGVLRIIDGAGTQSWATKDKWSLEDVDLHPYQYTNLAIGDIDKDGFPDVVLIGEMIITAPPTEDTSETGDTAPLIPESGESGDSETAETGDSENPVLPQRLMTEDGQDGEMKCCLMAVDHNLDLLWALTDEPMECGSHAPALADLEGDGAVEVIVGNLIVSGATGELRKKISAVGTYAAYPEIGFNSFALDLDGDGNQEVITGKSIHDTEGETLCELGSQYEDGFPAAADMNGDGYGEVVVVGNGVLKIFDRNCNISLEKTLEGSGNGGPPALADFDGDGQAEIGIANATHYAVYESDGQINWKVEIQDASSHATGSAVFDFEGDGRAEVLFADEVKFWIFDGKTGAVRYLDEEHASRTLHEYPLVVDVDGDDSPEIIIVHGGGHDAENSTGITVLGSANGDWIKARQVWNQHAYSITNINDDLSIPAPAVHNWPIYNSFRSANLGAPNQGGRVDTLPIFEGVCTDDCEEGSFKVLLRLANGGMGILPRGVPSTLYATDDSQSEALITLWSDSPLDPGTSTEPFILELDSELYGQATLEFVSDEDENGQGLFTECNEENNLVTETVECESTQ